MDELAERQQGWPTPTGWALILLSSLAMFGNYYVYDSIAPIADLLESQSGLTARQIGILNGVYSAAPIVMVLIGGLIIDRIGAARTSAIFAGICALGAVTTAAFPTFGGMVVGRFLFGLGSEVMIVGITALFGQWFRHQRLGLMLGLNLSLARGGSFSADMTAKWWPGLFEDGPAGPLWLAAGMAVLSFVFAVVCLALRPPAGAQVERQGAISLRGVRSFGCEYAWMVVLCTAIYSVLLPFRSTFAIQYYQEVQGLSREDAGALNGYVFLAAIFATPLFGWVFDRAGRRAPALFFGSLLMVPVFPLLAWTEADPRLSNVLLGLTFSLVPAVLWPSVAQLVEQGRLGTAYGLMTMVQNIGLLAFNLAAGDLNHRFDASQANPGGYTPMLVMFAALSLVSVLAAAVIWWRVSRGRTARL